MRNSGRWIEEVSTEMEKDGLTGERFWRYCVAFIVLEGKNS